MNTDTMDMFTKLPPDKQQVVNDFIAFLLQKYQPIPTVLNNAGESILNDRMRIAGRMKGKILMADDFNETPDNLKDYF